MKRIILVSICMFMATMSTFAIDYRGVGGNADFSAYKFEGQYYLLTRCLTLCEALLCHDSFPIGFS